MLDFYKLNKGMVARMIDVFVNLAEILLTLRVVLKFFFTNAGGGFVHWAFSTTDVLLAPFRGVFPHTTATPGNWYVDWVALFAMAVYMAAGYLLYNIALLWTPSGRK
ncbi:MAG: YggT family protein [Candidatus Saccharimonadales bacterium]